ncbi:MAG: hypothetical protein LBG66_00020 [Gallionellaceae bacterium]|jgi:type II secretory pathway component PulC|nr:hypothetical protein [Gallionellaceae bacterium]
MENRGNVPARRTILWRALGAVTLGALLAYWSWTLFAPRAVAVAVEPPRQASAEAGQLFGVAARNAQAESGDAQPGATLVGVFAPKSGKQGFAVLKLDGKQQVGVALGGNTPSGATLTEIHADYVILERGGARQRVPLDGGQSNPPATNPAQAPQAQNANHVAGEQAAAQAAQAARQLQMQNQNQNQAKQPAPENGAEKQGENKAD